MCFCFVCFIFWDGNKENCRDEDCWAVLGQTLFCTFKYLSWIFYKNISLNIEFKSEQRFWKDLSLAKFIWGEKLAVFVFFIKWWRSLSFWLNPDFLPAYSQSNFPLSFFFFLTGLQFSDPLHHYRVSQRTQHTTVEPVSEGFTIKWLSVISDAHIKCTEPILIFTVSTTLTVPHTTHVMYGKYFRNDELCWSNLNVGGLVML